MGLANYTPTSYKDIAPSDTLGLLPELTTTAAPTQAIAMDAVTEEFPLHALKQYDQLQQNVIDGDTIKGSQFGLAANVRLKGYNAPEMADKKYDDQTYIDAALTGTTTPEQALGLEAKRDLISNTFTMQKVAGLAEAKDRKLLMMTEGYDKGGQRLLGGIYGTKDGKITDDISSRMLAEGDSNVWFEKNDPQTYEKSKLEKQLIDQALSKAQNSNDSNDWARYENLIQRSGLSKGEKDVYLNPDFLIAKPVANAVIGAGELTSKAGNLAIELMGKAPRAILDARNTEASGELTMAGVDQLDIQPRQKVDSKLLDTIEAATKAPSSKAVEEAFAPIREQLNQTFNTTIFSELRPAETASVAKAVHDWENGREGAGAIGIAKAVFNGLVNEENAAMLIPGAGMSLLVLGKAKEFEDSGASKEKALAYGAMYTVLNKIGLNASLGQVKNLANLAAGRFATNAGLELLTENAQSLLELDAAGKINSIKDVEQSLRQTTLETAPSAVFGGTTGLAKDIYKGGGSDALFDQLDKIRNTIDARKAEREAQQTNKPATPSAPMTDAGKNFDSIYNTFGTSMEHDTVEDAHATGQRALDAIAGMTQDELEARKPQIAEILERHKERVKTTAKEKGLGTLGAQPEALESILDTILNTTSDTEAQEMASLFKEDVDFMNQLKSAYGEDAVTVIDDRVHLAKEIRDIDIVSTEVAATGIDKDRKGFLQHFLHAKMTGDASGLDTFKARQEDKKSILEANNNRINASILTQIQARVAAAKAKDTSGKAGVDVLVELLKRHLSRTPSDSTQTALKVDSVKFTYGKHTDGRPAEYTVKPDFHVAKVVKDLVGEEKFQQLLTKAGVKTQGLGVTKLDELIGEVAKEIDQMNVLKDRLAGIRRPAQSINATADESVLQAAPKTESKNKKKPNQAKADYVNKHKAVVKAKKALAVALTTVEDLMLSKMDAANTAEDVRDISDSIFEAKIQVKELHKQLKNARAKAGREFEKKNKPKGRNVAREASAAAAAEPDTDKRPKIFKTVLDIAGDVNKERDLYSDDKLVAEMDAASKEAAAKEEALFYELFDEVVEAYNEDERKNNKASTKDGVLRAEPEGLDNALDKTLEKPKPAAKGINESKLNAEGIRILNVLRKRLQNSTDKDRAVVKRAIDKFVKEVQRGLNGYDSKYTLPELIKEAAQKREQDKKEEKQYVKDKAEQDLAEQDANAKEFVEEQRKKDEVTVQEFTKGKLDLYTLGRLLEYAWVKKSPKYKEMVQEYNKLLATEQGNYLALDETIAELKNKIAEATVKLEQVKAASSTSAVDMAKRTLNFLKTQLKEATKRIKGTKYIQAAVTKAGLGGRYSVKLGETTHKADLTPAKLIKFKETASSVLGTVAAEEIGKQFPVFKEQLRIFKKNLAKVVKPVEDQTALDMLHDPVRAILFNADGTMNDNVVAAIMVATMSVLGDKGEGFNLLSDHQLEVQYGENYQEKMTPAEIATARKMGAFKVYVTDSIGHEVYNLLGLEPVGTVSATTAAMMLSGIGHIGLLTAAKQGIIEVTEKSTEELAKLLGKDTTETLLGTTSFVKMVTDKATSTRDLGKMLIENVGSEYSSKGYRTARRKTSSKPLPQRNNKYNVANQTLTNVVSTLTNQENFMVLDAVGELFMYDEDVIMKRMGYVELGTDNTPVVAEKAGQREYTYADIQEIIGQNEQIERNFAALQKMYKAFTDDENKVPNSAFFDWFVSKNNRIFVDSDDVNYMNDKHLARWALVLKAQVAEVPTDVNNDTDMKLTMFKLALAQAFGIDVDKIPTAESKAIGTAILKMDDSELYTLEIQLVENGEARISVGDKEVKLKVKEIMHTVLGINEAVKYVTAAKNGQTSYSTSMTYEADALTSAVANKLLQLPVGNARKWLAKAGVFIKGADGKYDESIEKIYAKKFAGKKPTQAGLEKWLKTVDMNDILALKEFLDSYQTLAEGMGTSVTIAQRLQTAALATKTNYETKEEEYTKQALTLQSSLMNVLVMAEEDLQSDTAVADLAKMFDGFKKLLGKDTAIIENGEVTKFGRDLFKYPFMIFLYSAGFNRIKKEFTGTLSNRYARAILESTDEEVMASLNAVISTKGINLKQLRDDIRNKPLKEVMLTDGLKLESLTDVMFGEFYGTSVVDIMKTEFADLIAVNRTINANMALMGRLYSRAFEKLTAGKTAITVDEEAALIRQLEKAFPSIRHPFGKSDRTDGIGIYDTERYSVHKEDAFQHTQTAVNPAEYDQKTISVQSLRRKLIEAITSGAVMFTHSADGAALTLSLADGEVKGVHDALILGVGQSDKMSEYSKNMLDVHKGWNQVQSIAAAMTEALDVTVKDNDGKTLLAMNEVLQELIKEDEALEDTSKRLNGYKGIDDLIRSLFEMANPNGALLQEKARMEDAGIIAKHMVFGPNGTYSTADSNVNSDIIDILDMLEEAGIDDAAISKIQKTAKKQGCL